MFELPAVVNPEPDVEMAEMMRFELLLFVRVISCEVDVPTCTFPKFRLEALVESMAAAAVGDVVLPFDPLVVPFGAVATGLSVVLPPFAVAVPLGAVVAEVSIVRPLVDVVGLAPADCPVVAQPTVPIVAIEANTNKRRAVHDLRSDIFPLYSRLFSAWLIPIISLSSAL